MITCKLCGTELGPRMKRKDGSMLCPVCGQIYWKAAVDRALSSAPSANRTQEVERNYLRESRKSVEFLRHARLA